MSSLPDNSYVLTGPKTGAVHDVEPPDVELFIGVMAYLPRIWNRRSAHLSRLIERKEN
jgi:hypothetical protein